MKTVNLTFPLACEAKLRKNKNNFRITCKMKVWSDLFECISFPLQREELKFLHLEALRNWEVQN